MKTFAVIGDPIEHSLSPRIHGLFFERHGLEASYERIRVGLDDVAEALATLRGRMLDGINVTYPLKAAVIPHLEGLDEGARRLGAVNTLVRPGPGSDHLVGYNSDGEGFCLNAERELGMALAGRRVLILGAGKTARSVAAALVDRGIGRLVIVNRSPAPLADPLLEELSRRVDLWRVPIETAASTGSTASRGPTESTGSAGPGETGNARAAREAGEIGEAKGERGDGEAREAREAKGEREEGDGRGAGDAEVRWDRVFDVDLVIHATSLGLSGSRATFPWPLDRIRPGTRVVDLNYLPHGRTPFLEALPAGVEATDGKGMLLYQAARAFELWWGFFPRMEGLATRLFETGSKG